MRGCSRTRRITTSSGRKGTLADRSAIADVFDIQWHNLQEARTSHRSRCPGPSISAEPTAAARRARFRRTSTEHISGQLDYTYDITQDYGILRARPRGGEPGGGPPPVGTPLPGTPKNSIALGTRVRTSRARRRRDAIRTEWPLSKPGAPAISESIPVVPGYTMLNARASYALSRSGSARRSST